MKAIRNLVAVAVLAGAFVLSANVASAQVYYTNSWVSPPIVDYQVYHSGFPTYTTTYVPTVTYRPAYPTTTYAYPTYPTYPYTTYYYGRPYYYVRPYVNTWRLGWWR